MGNDTLKTLGFFAGGVAVLCGLVYGLGSLVSNNRTDDFAVISHGGSAVTKKRHKRHKNKRKSHKKH
jgi:hypothetical protein